MFIFVDTGVRFDSHFQLHIGSAKLEILEEYPLVVAMVDGRVEHVCAHPEDQPWSVNLKKTIPAQMQNSLPSFAAAVENEGMTFTEV